MSVPPATALAGHSYGAFGLVNPIHALGRAEVELVGDRPTGSVPPDSPILAAVRRADAALGIQTRFAPGSTDSNVPIGLGVPAVTLRGGGDGIGNHVLNEQFDTTDSHRGTQRALLALLEITGVAPAK